MKRKALIVASIGVMASALVGAVAFGGEHNFNRLEATDSYSLTVTPDDVHVLSSEKSTVNTSYGSLITFGHTNIGIDVDGGTFTLAEGTLFNYDDLEANPNGGALSGLTSITVDVVEGSLTLSYGWETGVWSEDTIALTDNVACDLSDLHPNYFKLSGTATFSTISVSYTCTRGTDPMMTVYLKSSWANANIYTWDANGTALKSWPGTAMEKNEDGLYFFRYNVQKYINVIFNDGSEQTENLLSPTSTALDCFDYSKGTWINDEDAFVSSGTAKVYVVLSWSGVTDVKLNGAAMSASDDATKGNYVCEIEAGAAQASFSFKQSGATWHPDNHAEKTWDTSAKIDFGLVLEAGGEYQITDINWKYQWDNQEHKWFSYTVNTL